MRRLTPLTILALTACQAAEAKVDVAPNQAAATQFERLAALGGTWTVKEGADPMLASAVTYELTAGGSTVVETLFGGTDHEMLTAYYLDGGELVLTHYCMLGNQPHMRARSGPEDEISFECEGGGNLPTCRAQHMHRAHFRFVDDSTLRTTWTMYDAGEAVEEVTLLLERDAE